MAENKKFDVVSKKNIYIMIPCIVLAAMLIVIAIFNANVSIEFKGGTILTYAYTGTIDTSSVKSLVEGLNYGNVIVTTGSDFNSDLETVTVSFSSNKGLSTEEQSSITDMLKEKFPENNISLEDNKNVNPSTGIRTLLKCLVAVAFAFIVLVIYIALRFRKIGGWSAGVFALVALLVDVLMVSSSFIFFRFSIDSIFVAVVLTIMGYSINNTIVIYDRVRENRTLYGKKLSHRELVNLSVRQSLTRAINTTVTTGLAVLVICIVAMIFGVSSIISFAFPMFIGLISGVFTSLCLSGTLWVTWQEYKIKNKTKPQNG